MREVLNAEPDIPDSNSNTYNLYTVMQLLVQCMNREGV